MRYIILFLVGFKITTGFSQEEENSNIILSYSENQDIYFYEYEPRSKIIGTYLIRSEALNEYPEQLMMSVLSATNQDWVNYNTFKQLNTSIFSDLTPSLSIKPIATTEIYKKSREVYDVLNITKLYSLYNTNPDLFIKYLE